MKFESKYGLGEICIYNPEFDQERGCYPGSEDKQ